MSWTGRLSAGAARSETGRRGMSLRLAAVLSGYRLAGAVRWLEAARVPPRLRGTVAERWAEYWRTLMLDYVEVGRDTARGVRASPVRAAAVASAVAALSYLVSTNPDEVSFRDEVTRRGNDLLLVGEEVLNPESVQHVQDVGAWEREGRLSTLSLGFLTLVLLRDHSPRVNLFRATCSYLQPRWWSVSEQVVDVGAVGRWWILSSKMKDYDINPAEWSRSRSSTSTNIRPV